MFLKQKKPINKLAKILLLICQILIFTIATFMLAQPILASAQNEPKEKIVIIDASVAMLAKENDVTRFDRAIALAISLGHTTVQKEALFSVILADDQSDYVIMRADTVEAIDEAMQGLTCPLGSADITGAMKKAEVILKDNPDAEVLFYTSKKYDDDGEVEVRDMSRSSEWNAAIMDFSSMIVDNYHVFNLELACYGKDMDVPVRLFIDGAEATVPSITINGKIVTVQNNIITVPCRKDNSVFVQFKEQKLLNYEYAQVFIEPYDSFSYDDTMFLYAKKETIKIQYASSYPSTFINALLDAFFQSPTLSSKFDLQITRQQTNVVETSGYDLYILESLYTKTLPTDGVVWMINPSPDLGNTSTNGLPPENSGLTFAGRSSGSYTCTSVSDSPILESVKTSAIKMSEYIKVTGYEGYDPLIKCNGDPVLLVKNTRDSKVTMLGFDLHQTDLPILFIDFIALFSNLFDYYFPVTISQKLPITVTHKVVDVGGKLTLNIRDNQLAVRDPNGKLSIIAKTGAEVVGVGEEVPVIYVDFPYTFVPTEPGRYIVTQQLMTKNEEGAYNNSTEMFFVRIPKNESNFALVYDTLANPMIFSKDKELIDLYLLIYFASALAALLFIEWLLQARDQF